MLEFYYNFLDRFRYRRDFDLIGMDTNNNYIGISAARFEDAVKRELRAEFGAKKARIGSVGLVE